MTSLYVKESHSAVMPWKASIKVQDNNKAFSLFWNSPPGSHPLIATLLRYFFQQLMDPVILYITQKQERATKKHGGVKIARRLWGCIVQPLNAKEKKGGVRGADAGNHPKGSRVEGAEARQRNKVQVTS